MTAASKVKERRRFLLVSNPIAGQARRSLTEDVVYALQALGAEVTSLPLGADVRHTDWAALAADYDAVIAAGGDGTVRALGAVLQGAGLPIGVIPRGTGNVLAEEIRLPREPVKLARILISGPRINVRGARVNDEPFFLMAGIGFDGEIVRRLDLGMKRKVGKLAYVGPTLAALVEGDPRLACEIDGQVHEAGWAIVTNARCYGGSFQLTHRAGLEKDGLVAILFERGGFVHRSAQLAALALGRLERAPGVRVLETRHIRITADRPVAVEVDGDAFGTGAIEITWGEPVLNLIVPESYAKRWNEAHAPTPASGEESQQ